MLLGSLAVVSRPDPSRWTGRSDQPATEKHTSLSAIQQPSPKKGSDRLTFHTVYTRCGHNRQTVHPVSAVPDAVRLELHYSSWQVQAVSDGFLLRRQIDQICPDHLLARRENGYLSLYPNREHDARLTRIALLQDPLQADHGQNIAAELEEGIVFDDLEALEHYLESLDS